MTVIPIFIPVEKETKPPWEFEGDWTAEDKAIVEAVLQKHNYKHKKPYRKNWLLICRNFKGDADYHASYGADVSLYGDTVEELVERIETYYITGKVPANMFSFESTAPAISVGQKTDEWLSQIRRLHDEDRLKLQREQEQQQSQSRQEAAAELLRQSKAHELLRYVQKALLNGAGLLQVLGQSEEYDEAIVLMWQGAVSAARKPNNVNEDYSYILVGVKKNKVWVNGKAISEVTSEALKAGLLEVCKSPSRGRVH